MKILTKLLLGFLTVAALCGIVGTVGMVEMTRLTRSLREISGTTLDTLDTLQAINVQLVAIKVAQRSIAHPYGLLDPAYLQTQQDAVAEARKVYAELIEKYEALPKIPEEARRWNDIKVLIPTVRTYTDAIMNGAAAAAAARTEEQRDAMTLRLYELISGDERLIMDDFLAAVDELIAFNRAHYAGAVPRAAIASANRGIAVLLGVAVVALLAAAVLGILLGRSISSSLKRAVSVLDKIASGDTSDRLTVKSRDEFAQVAASLDTVAGTLEALVSEAGRLTEAAVAGRLGVRADASSFRGSYSRLIGGINEIVDALVGFLDVMPAPAMIIDREYRVLYMNKAGASLGNSTGAQLAETRRACYDFFKTGDCKTERCACARAMQLKSAASSDTRATPLDKTYDISYTGVPVLDRSGAVVGAFEVIADQTAIKNAERFMKKNSDFQNAEIERLNVFLKRMADGDLSADFAVAQGDADTAETKARLDSLAGALNETVSAMNDILGQVAMAVEQVTAGSNQVSQASQALSQGATEQASSLEEITSSVTEIAGQTRRNTENAVRVNVLAGEAKENAGAGDRQMRELVTAMGDINRSAQEIGKIVKAIDDISFQINLLALNANVEAARAGKYGKGFAVVAEEVRNLAVRSAGSVKETTAMVDEAIANIGRGNSLVEVTAKQLASIVDGSSQVASLAEEVATAGREQSQGLEQITTGLNQIDQVTQSNTASAEESASAAEELSSQAQQLKGMVGRFKLKAAERGGSEEGMLAALRAELARREGRSGGYAGAPRALALHRSAETEGAS